MKSIALVSFLALVAVNQLSWIEFSSITNFVAATYHVSAFDVGLFVILFPLVYILTSLPVGWFIDSKGPYLSVTLGGALMTVSSFVRLAHGLFPLVIGQLGIAVAQPFLLNSTAKFAESLYPSRASLIIGAETAAVFVGIALGLGVPPLVLGDFLYFLLASAVTSLVFTALSLPSTKYPFVVLKGRGSVHLRELWPVYYVVGVGMGLFIGVLTWISQILAQFSDAQVGLVGTSLVLGGMIGSVILPAVTYRTGKVRLLLAVLPAVVVLSAIYALVSSLYAQVVVNVALGFLMVGAFPVLIDLAASIDPKQAGVVNSAVWFFGNLGGVAIPLGAFPLLSGVWIHYSVPMIASSALLAVGVAFVPRLKSLEEVGHS
ncbi:MFS transporter [Sulfodiicoccus acidiphilus]|uniref:MFS transporter n=1 Tax=Sulfodiicoccus acidiphilus TaxID=1670455 RepID=A0A348B5T6_9CREN|nr:MFS transporter [Sulfodiicoccus acidiphilus]BBD73538.1 MFS transporter [Sulfodiicoccus acidiphilus]GGT92451.1 MFS transporter [Sulfodiicoccus acidiphilus]